MRDENEQFGAIAPKSDWLLEPGGTFLNHGSYGATPRSVLAEQDRWRARMERRPTYFMSVELPQALRDAAGRLAAFVGSKADDLVFVENATAGCNAVLNSMPFAAGDEILVTDHGYAAVRNALEHAAKKSGAKVVEAKVPFPIDSAKQIIDAVGARLGARTRLVILDHITSPTAIVFPVRELTALCRAAGARVLIDGAHAPGMLALDVPSIGADWYVGNCHKWLMAPKGAGFLWTDPQHQRQMHPPVISHGYNKGYTDEFDWIGTRDPSAWLSVPAAIEVHGQLGGAALRERNVALAQRAAALISERWRSERGTPDALTGSMAAIRLPVSGDATIGRAVELRKWLFEEHRIEIAMTAFAGALWARISAQAYNELADYERLAAVFAS
ncbi:MAG TPA: aminotransferase class V-fold PLP-dependent enzyme [Pseudolabrys sp.]|nr:aminotransferase class V-fold PLP-dependent enzyme [Pseudolabrys sp.]